MIAQTCKSIALRKNSKCFEKLKHATNCTNMQIDFTQVKIDFFLRKLEKKFGQDKTLLLITEHLRLNFKVSIVIIPCEIC